MTESRSPSRHSKTLGIAALIGTVIAVLWCWELVQTLAVLGERERSSLARHQQAILDSKAEEFRDMFREIYLNGRTLSLLPMIRAVSGPNRRSMAEDVVRDKRLSLDAHRTVQQIYSSLRSLVRISEIYYVLDGFDPLAGDIPFFMYDDLIVGNTDALPRPSDPRQVEDEEYAHFPLQLDWFRRRAPQLIDLGEIGDIPMLVSSPLRTCDNTQFESEETGDLRDVNGFIVALPVYDLISNRFKGTINVMLRNNTLEARLLGVPFVPVTSADMQRMTAAGWKLPEADRTTSNFILRHAASGIQISDRRSTLFGANASTTLDNLPGRWARQALELNTIGTWELAHYLTPTEIDDLLGDLRQERRLAVAGRLFWLLLIVALAVWLGKAQSRTRDMSLARDASDAANKAKSEFLAMMSHEIRTPLSGIIGMQRLALRDAGLRHATREQLELAQQNATALMDIINDLLDFSKIEAGKLTLEIIDFALAPHIAGALAPLRKQAESKGLDFEVHLDDALPAYVTGDPTRLRQVMLNLASNAIKFTEQGKVRIEIAQLERANGRCRLRFTVEDTGIGIPSQALRRLFKKFTQADSSTTRRYGGTGLGLAISHQLVEQMGGYISVKSVVDLGSSFVFELQLALAAPPPLAQDDALPVPAHTHVLNVLCAEDYATNQLIIRAQLEEQGHRVHMVEDGAAAVDACTRTRYDVVLMDGRMPVMDGITATQLIRAGGTPERPVLDPQVCIIALTADAGEESRAKYLAAGMNDYLTKPLDEAALARYLQVVIDRQLARGVALPRRQYALDELDRMFGIAPETADVSDAPVAAPEHTPLKQRLRETFIKDIPGRLAQLDAALAAHDNNAAGMLFHGIKGSASYLEDAAELCALCLELERAADTADWATVGDKMPRLKKLLAQLLNTGEAQ
jgi:signal transduction histidine kinase/CheY-like chemotaxis protein/HPt (histidine-containing phosphotransfer) domain-containing protein